MNQLAAELVRRYTERGLKLTTAESCTGGLVAGAITEISGSSAVLERGFVTYSNDAKAEMLGVPSSLIEQHGAVSEQVARAMAEGALAHSRADVAVSITGVAGPTGGSPQKPVGLVWFGLAVHGQETQTGSRNFSGDRASIRQASVEHALRLLLSIGC
jgi:nicotinamide-nucleotide amidase